MNDTKLHINEGEESFVRTGSIGIDAKYFDLDSLIRLYGKSSIEKYYNVKLVYTGGIK